MSGMDAVDEVNGAVCADKECEVNEMSGTCAVRAVSEEPAMGDVGREHAAGGERGARSVAPMGTVCFLPGNRTLQRLVSIGGVGAAVLALAAGCGEPSARPMDDEYAGNSGQVAESGESCCDGDADGDAAGQDGDGGEAAVAGDDASSGTVGAGAAVGTAYADGEYAAIGQYGPVGEDTIDVYLGVKDGVVSSVRVEGHPFTSISRGHQEDFAAAVPGVVVGRKLDGLKVDKVAGASWTSDAFNAALDEVRRQAAEQG